VLGGAVNMLDMIVRLLGVGVCAFVIGLAASPIMPSYVPKLHPVFMAIGVCLFFTQGLVAYTANFGDNVRTRAHGWWWGNCCRGGAHALRVAWIHSSGGGGRGGHYTARCRCLGWHSSVWATRPSSQ